MHSQNHSERNSMTISWSQVEEKFYRRYAEIFDVYIVKAHLDSCGKVIDNAKQRWKELVLLDAVLSHTSNHDMCPCRRAGPVNNNIVYRGRQFDQHRELVFCIQECAAEDQQRQESRATDFSSKSNSKPVKTSKKNSSNSKSSLENAISDENGPVLMKMDNDLMTKHKRIAMFNTQNQKVFTYYQLTEIEPAYHTVTALHSHLFGSLLKDTTLPASNRTLNAQRREEIMTEMVGGCLLLRDMTLADALFNLVVDVVTSPRLLPLIPSDSHYKKVVTHGAVVENGIDSYSGGNKVGGNVNTSSNITANHNQIVAHSVPAPLQNKFSSSLPTTKAPQPSAAVSVPFVVPVFPSETTSRGSAHGLNSVRPPVEVNSLDTTSQSQPPPLLTTTKLPSKTLTVPVGPINAQHNAFTVNTAMTPIISTSSTIPTVAVRASLTAAPTVSEVSVASSAVVAPVVVPASNTSFVSGRVVSAPVTSTSSISSKAVGSQSLTAAAAAVTPGLTSQPLNPLLSPCAYMPPRQYHPSQQHLGGGGDPQQHDGRNGYPSQSPLNHNIYASSPSTLGSTTAAQSSLVSNQQGGSNNSNSSSTSNLGAVRTENQQRLEEFNRHVTSSLVLPPLNATAVTVPATVVVNNSLNPPSLSHSVSQGPREFVLQADEYERYQNFLRHQQQQQQYMSYSPFMPYAMHPHPHAGMMAPPYYDPYNYYRHAGALPPTAGDLKTPSGGGREDYPPSLHDPRYMYPPLPHPAFPPHQFMPSVPGGYYGHGQPFPHLSAHPPPHGAGVVPSGEHHIPPSWAAPYYSSYYPPHPFSAPPHAYHHPNVYPGVGTQGASLSSNLPLVPTVPPLTDVAHTLSVTTTSSRGDEGSVSFTKHHQQQTQESKPEMKSEQEQELHQHVVESAPSGTRGHLIRKLSARLGVQNEDGSAAVFAKRKSTVRKITATVNDVADSPQEDATDGTSEDRKRKMGRSSGLRSGHSSVRVVDSSSVLVNDQLIEASSEPPPARRMTLPVHALLSDISSYQQQTAVKPKTKKQSSFDFYQKNGGTYNHISSDNASSVHSEASSSSPAKKVVASRSRRAQMTESPNSDEEVTPLLPAVVETEKLSSRGRVIREIQQSSSTKKLTSRHSTGGMEPDRVEKEDTRDKRTHAQKILPMNPKSTAENRNAAVQLARNRLICSTQSVQTLPSTLSPPTDCGQSLALRDGLQKGAWCQPGRVVGVFADGVGAVTTSALFVGVVLDDFAPSVSLVGFVASDKPTTMDYAAKQGSVKRQRNSEGGFSTAQSIFAEDVEEDMAGYLLVALSGEVAVTIDLPEELSTFYNGPGDELLCVDHRGAVVLMSSQFSKQNKTHSLRKSEQINDFRVFGLARRSLTSFRTAEVPIAHFIRCQTDSSLTVDFRDVDQSVDELPYPKSVEMSNNSDIVGVSSGGSLSHWRRGSWSRFESLFNTPLNVDNNRTSFAFTTKVKDSKLKESYQLQNGDQSSSELDAMSHHQFSSRENGYLSNDNSSDHDSLAGINKLSEVEVEVCAVKGVRVVLTLPQTGSAIWEQYATVLGLMESRAQDSFVANWSKYSSHTDDKLAKQKTQLAVQLVFLEDMLRSSSMVGVQSHLSTGTDSKNGVNSASDALSSSAMDVQSTATDGEYWNPDM